MAIIRVPSALRNFTHGNADVETAATTVRDAIADLDRKGPGIAARLLDGGGSVKPHIRIYVGPEDITELQGLDTKVSDRDEISIVPAIAAGR